MYLLLWNGYTWESTFFFVSLAFYMGAAPDQQRWLAKVPESPGLAPSPGDHTMGGGGHRPATRDHIYIYIYICVCVRVLWLCFVFMSKRSAALADWTTQ